MARPRIGLSGSDEYEVRMAGVYKPASGLDARIRGQAGKRNLTGIKTAPKCAAGVDLFVRIYTV
jgi:hypothetical protein